jgi:hypothetical protein
VLVIGVAERYSHPDSCGHGRGQHAPHAPVVRVAGVRVRVSGRLERACTTVCTIQHRVRVRGLGVRVGEGSMHHGMHLQGYSDR